MSQAAADALVPASCAPLTASQLAAITVTRNAATGALTLALPSGVAFSSNAIGFTSGSSTVAGSISAASGTPPMATVTPSSALGAGTWSWTVNAQPVGAPAVVKMGSFVVPVVVVPPACAAPNVVNTVSNTCINAPASSGYTFNPNLGGGGAFVADIGVLVTGANTLPAACVSVGDACWVQSVQNGTIKFVNSGAVMTGINTRPIVFAFYVTSGGVYNAKAIYGDDGLAAATTGVSGGGISGIVSAKGSQNGVKLVDNYGSCGETYFVGGGFATNVITCPI